MSTRLTFEIEAVDHRSNYNEDENLECSLAIKADSETPDCAYLVIGDKTYRIKREELQRIVDVLDATLGSIYLSRKGPE